MMSRIEAWLATVFFVPHHSRRVSDFEGILVLENGAEGISEDVILRGIVSVRGKSDDWGIV
jgi:ABC-type transport system involved in cytochrome bd biosynthesis fused ATPase/permease subunit